MHDLCAHILKSVTPVLFNFQQGRDIKANNGLMLAHRLEADPTFALYWLAVSCWDYWLDLRTHDTWIYCWLHAGPASQTMG